MKPLLVLMVLLLSSQSYAGSLNPSRTLYIEGAISGQTLEPLSDKLVALINSTVRSGSKEQVNLIISSPGGEVIMGTQFINRIIALRGLGVPVVCYVQDMAASMAFQILTQCSKRFALSTSYLLWHGVRTRMNQVITTQVAESLAEDLQMMDDSVLHQLEEVITMKDMVRHFERETLWTGRQLASEEPGFITVQDNFSEVTEALASSKITRSGQDLPFFGQSGKQDTNRPVYYLIWSRYEYLLLNTEGK